MAYLRIVGYKGQSEWYARDDHFFVAARSRGIYTSMRCASNGCPARWTLRGIEAQAIVGQHDHPPTPWVPNRNAMFQALKRRAATETIPLHTIYEEEAGRYRDAASYLLWDSVAPSMRKWRRAVQPEIPASLTGYAAALAEHRSYNHLLLASVSAGGATAVILAQNGFGRCLRDSRTIVVDATFLTVPAGAPAAQLLTIHAVIQGHYFHPILVLMENRRRALYEAIFRRVWQVAGNPQPEHVVTDFETALQNALETVTGVQVQGCLFHFVQALLRHARICEIPVGHNSPGWKMVQLYATIALLPAAQVRLGLAEIPAIIEERELPYNQVFHDYFESQWMTRVGPERLSVHGSPHRTSNIAESFHASLRLALGASPNIWRFTEVADLKFNISWSRLEALRDGRLPRRNRERNYVRTNVHAGNQRALERGLITLREFINDTSQLLDVGARIIADVPDYVQEVEVAFEPEAAPLGALEVAALPEPQREIANVADDMQNRPGVGLEPVVLLEVQEPLQVPAQLRPVNPAPILCRICEETAPTLVLIPCGHPLCAQCFIQIIDCPFCRSPIRATNPLYLM